MDEKTNTVMARMLARAVYEVAWGNKCIFCDGVGTTEEAPKDRWGFVSVARCDACQGTGKSKALLMQEALLRQETALLSQDKALLGLSAQLSKLSVKASAEGTATEGTATEGDSNTVENLHGDIPDARGAGVIMSVMSLSHDGELVPIMAMGINKSVSYTFSALAESVWLPDMLPRACVQDILLSVYRELCARGEGG